MKFLDFNTGYSFDAVWTDGQTNGYTFWFPSAQSVGISYTMPICIITSESKPLALSFEDNDIFSFIRHNSTVIDVDGFKFETPIYESSVTTVPEELNGKYLHKFNVAAKSDADGEFVCKMYIDGVEQYIKIGADFYIENELTYINLSNLGVEIPHLVQKTIYETNVHEDNKDNILLNRKFKELLSNYWDVIANKGSYKSLANSLDWFEWGDMLDVKEVWKSENYGRTFFRTTDLFSSIEEKYMKTFETFSKTTYVALYTNLYNELDEYDSELNPRLEQIVTMWSKDELHLKLSLLAQFFGSFFLPIHTSILQAAVEDIVFTNTIKTHHGNESGRNDVVGDFEYVECNIKDGDIFRLESVKAQVTDKTIYAYKNGNDNVFGVDEFPMSGTVSDINRFAASYYAGPGAIVPFEFVIPDKTNTEFIKYTTVDFIPYGSDVEQKFIFNDVIYGKGGKITIKFNFLSKGEKDYSMRFTFMTSSSKTLTKTVNFSVKEVDNVLINVYKIKSKNDDDYLTYNDWLDNSCSQYLFRMQDNQLPNEYYLQYIPYMDETNELFEDYDGVKLSRTVVVNMLNQYNVSKYTNAELRVLRSQMKRFLEFHKYKLDEDGNKTDIISNIIFVSKRFYEPVPEYVLNQYDVIRNDLGFYPQFHKLVKLDGNSIEDYTISQYDAICCAAEVQNSNYEQPKPIRYSNMMNSVEWSFINCTTDDIVEFPASSRQPFIAMETDDYIPDGFYDIVFNCSMSDGSVKTYKVDSAFRKKSIKTE